MERLAMALAKLAMALTRVATRRVNVHAGDLVLIRLGLDKAAIAVTAKPVCIAL
jgi:thioester reductase-like protein